MRAAHWRPGWRLPHVAAAFDARWDGHGISAARFAADAYDSLRPHFVGT